MSDNKLLSVVGTYLAPETSTNAYAKPERAYFQQEMPQLISKLELEHRCFALLGDTNARVADASDLKQREPDLGNHEEIFGEFPRAPNIDIHKNLDGEITLDLARASYDLWLLNGRTLEQR